MLCVQGTDYLYKMSSALVQNQQIAAHGSLQLAFTCFLCVLNVLYF